MHALHTHSLYASEVKRERAPGTLRRGALGKRSDGTSVQCRTVVTAVRIAQTPPRVLAARRAAFDHESVRTVAERAPRTSTLMAGLQDFARSPESAESRAKPLWDRERCCWQAGNSAALARAPARGEGDV